ncbi:MAG: DEAD/DEAH box helicase [Agrobacterium albertimagni]
MTALASDRPVRHPRHGEGRVVADLGDTIIVRFGATLEQVERGELEVVRSLADALTVGVLDNPLAVLARAQALLIRSINDQWGVFSRSRVQLLPHQLWVCRQVTQRWPARWLVADDVGLGKTIEAGLILTPLMAGGRIRRLLILAPARLVPQWRARLKSMFDIRLNAYTREQDRGKISFWDTASQVVASFHTLRQPAARDRLLAAEPWDMVMVDEAHHFQAQERLSTQTYDLLRELQDRDRIQSLVLFTGTPHRGKDFGFLALMRLIRPDLFDPRQPVGDQLPKLREAMIRNNKALVTDLEGRRLFQPVSTETVDYDYTPAEATFYQTMSAFILDGRAYALNLTGREQSARMLLLIALQKLAASSIAAIRSALERRRAMLAEAVQRATADLPEEAETLDEAAEQDEALPDQMALFLMQGEIERLDELIALACGIKAEAKIARLIALIDDQLPPGEPLLLFTEYKATQALVIAALEARFGKGSAGFINGDERLAVPEPDGAIRVRNLSRDAAAADFNKGSTRFLVATEAGGEGIDLQDCCATLVHVDLPWNPMRLHQRVGRLNRYGQKRAVRVFLLRNPATVEARIWALLEAKLARIQAALSASMEEAEDIAQLVIGMQGGRFFDELFTEGATALAGGARERLADWFDAHTATFGGRDALETVRAMLGQVARFDFGAIGGSIPRIDLPALEPFFRNAMVLMGRRVTRGDEGLAVATPEDWKRSLDLQPRYDGLVFDRSLPGTERMNRLLGVGHPLLDHALGEAAGRPVLIGRVRDLAQPMLLAAVEDEVTGTGGTVHRVVVAVEGPGTDWRPPLADWQALDRLNACLARDDHAAPLTFAEQADMQALLELLPRALPSVTMPFRRPRAVPLLCLLPDRTV